MDLSYAVELHALVPPGLVWHQPSVNGRALKSRLHIQGAACGVGGKCQIWARWRIWQTREYIFHDLTEDGIVLQHNDKAHNI